MWISNFFMDATNLIYYIRGTRNVEMFCGGMGGMQAFNGAALFAITPFKLSYVTQPIWFRPQEDSPRPKRLAKSKSPIVAAKWRYMYETGRMVWGKSGIDLEKLGQAMEKSVDGDSDRSKEYRRGNDVMDIDPKVNQSTPQGKSATSEKGQGKKVATLRGGSARSDSVMPSYKDGLNTGIADVFTAEDQINLRAYMMAKQCGNPDELWASLKNIINVDRCGAIERKEITEDLAEEVTLLAQCEESVKQSWLIYPHAKGRLALDRSRLIRRIVNTSAQVWKEQSAMDLNQRFDNLQRRGVDKIEIASGLLDNIISATKDKKCLLNAEEMKVLHDLVDNLELQRDFQSQLGAGSILTSNPEEIAKLKDVEASLATERKIFTSRLVAIKFKDQHGTRQTTFEYSTRDEELNEGGIPPAQEVSVATVMETTRCDKVTAIRLLHQLD